MAYGKRFDEWDRASLLAALLHNDPQGARPRRTIESFNPFLADTSTEDAAVVVSDPAALAKLLGATLHTVQ